MTVRASYPPILLDEAALAALPGRLTRFGRVRYSVSVDSTNAKALESIHAYDALGISFVTEYQGLGRGRAGRLWESPPAAGLLCSTILPLEVPHEILPAIGFWASLAARSAIRTTSGLETALKWPNDLLLGALKCAGVLCEARSSGATSRVVVGVGINVNRPAGVPEELELVAGWLSDEALCDVNRTSLLDALLSTYEQSFDDLLRAPESVIAKWAAAAALEGTRVSVKAVDGSVLHDGVVLGLDRDGALLLRTDGGDVRILLGDVSAI
ncbi:MAG TPA: biotin--[acetyl-CoA-carboxylase] ligase [Candidatus Eremiobacteraceae bacterium]